MRDPDLVLRAQQAAAALERAWRRWRYLHGLAADPMPPVSSYVGYSLDEPWGQPRVVFGLAAEEAGQLAMLLEGHDCVGPIHAAVAPPSGSLRESEGASQAKRLPVPPQGPSSGAELTPLPDRPDYGRGQHNVPPGPDGRRAAPGPAAGQLRRRPGKPAVQQGMPQRQQPAAGRPAAGRADRDVPLFRAAAAAARKAAGARAAEAMAHAHEAAILEDAERERARRAAGRAGPAHHGNPVVRDAAARAAAALPGPASAPANRRAAYYPEPGYLPAAEEAPGPLTLAASAARDEAEARIRSALNAQRSAAGRQDRRGSAGRSDERFAAGRGDDAGGPESPGAGGGPAWPQQPGAGGGPAWPQQPGAGGGPAWPQPGGGGPAWPQQAGAGAGPAWPQDGGAAGRARPEAAAGATFIRPVGATHAFHPDPLEGPAWPDSAGNHPGAGSPPGVVAFRARPDLSAYPDGDAELDAGSGDASDYPAGGQGARSRTRGHSMPRPSRFHRPGAAPGA